MRKMRRSRKARRTMVDCRPGTRIARYVGSIASRSMMPKTLFMYRVGRRTATMRAVYSTVKRPVKNHSACIKKTPYTACRDSTLSSITISTLVTMLHSKTSSKSLPARVSDSKMTLWSFPRQPPSGPCASCCIPLEDPLPIADMIADKEHEKCQCSKRDGGARDGAEIPDRGRDALTTLIARECCLRARSEIISLLSPRARPTLRDHESCRVQELL